MNVNNISHVLELPQGTISQYIMKLKHAVIIEKRKGLEIYCELVDERTRQTTSYLFDKMALLKNVIVFC